MDILEIKNVTYNYSNSNEKVLSSVNQKFEIGKFYAIIGKSGAGKSTLLSLLAGLDKPQKGQILFKGNVILNIIVGGFMNSDDSTIMVDSLLKNNNLISNLITFMQSYGILIGIIVLSVIIASLMILIKKPKEILSKIS